MIVVVNNIYSNQITTNKRLLKLEDKVFDKEYRKLEPSNGWGTYEGLLQEFRDLRECCEQNLDGIISID